MEEWLTEQDVIDQTGASRRRLTRLRQSGLIPSPRRRSRGLHKGTASDYPAGTVAMIRRLDGLAAERRDAGEWLWRLWLEGYPVEIRKHLAARLDKAAALLAGIDSPEKLETLLTTARVKRSRKRNIVPARETAGRLLYDRIRRPSDWFSVLYWALSVALGFVTDADSSSAFETVKRALKLPADFGSPQFDSGNASLAALTDALLRMSDDEAERARLDCIVLSEVANRLSAIGEGRSAPILLKFFHRQWRKLTVRAGVVAFLVILRKSPEISANIDTIIQMLKWLDRRAKGEANAA
jgi:hypothetical protein